MKKQLKNTRLSNRWQARIVQACVESSLLFYCQGCDEIAEVDG